jgi:hypothetical protein
MMRLVVIIFATSVHKSLAVGRSGGRLAARFALERY